MFRRRPGGEVIPPGSTCLAIITIKHNYIPLCTNLPKPNYSSPDIADCFLVKEREHKKSPEMFGAENKKIVIKCGEAGRLGN